MAISLTCYQLLKLLKDRGELPQGGRILEIGKANWYGDASPSVISELIPPDCNSFVAAELMYELLFDYKPDGDGLVAFDQDPAAVARGAIPVNLNHRRDIASEFSTVINHGTAEHVFHISNVFELMHDACEVGGLMIHESPFTGWTSHGFYCLQPTLFYDVARDNGYEMVLVATEHLRSRSYQIYDSHEAILQAKFRDQLPDHAMLFVAMRKVSDGLFKIPNQAVYAGAASEFVRQAWRELR